MDNEKMGQFISELRKSQEMTQKELAAKLNITDKAVSKWERGLSSPDIALLSPLSDILGVTTNELLSGERSEAEVAAVEASVVNALHYADKAVKIRANSILSICAVAYSALLLLGIIVCAICDLAVSGALTWSLIPISAILFAWVSLFPVIKYGSKGILGALLAGSASLLPFLYVLDHLIKTTDMILPVGGRMAVISMAFLWAVFGVFRWLKARKLLAGAVSLVLAIPLNFFIDLALSQQLNEPLLDVWDILAVAILMLAAAILFALNKRR